MMRAGRLQTGSQGLGLGIATVGDQHLVRDRCAVQQRFRAMRIGDLQMAEATQAQVIDPVDAPVGPFAPGLAEAAAIGDPQATSRPERGFSACRPTATTSC